jgi:glutamate-1-semialdehyde 2,1-aminomutase
LPVTNPMRYWDRAKAVIPGGTMTMSKAVEKYVKGVYPVNVVRAHGCIIEGSDGNNYVDYISALGPIILGYNHPTVTRKVTEAIQDGGPIFSLPHSSEAGLAEMMANFYPSAEMSRFFKTGSDALSAAVRVARAFTGKDKVLVCGYHGWHEWYTITTDKPAGIPKNLGENVGTFAYNDLESLRAHFKADDIAAVILEPVVYDAPKDDFLNEVIRIAHEHDALVVFDEVVTGFRFGLSGAAGYFQAMPDLACFSKAMGNGYPIAALCGKRDIMRTFERPDFLVSGTFNGDTVAIAAAQATLYVLRDNDGLAIRKTWAAGERLKQVFNDLSGLLGIEASARGFAPRTDFVFPTMEHKALFWQECVKKGVLFGYANFVNASHHTGIVESTCNVMETSLRVVKEHWADPKAALEGEVPQSPFVKR